MEIVTLDKLLQFGSPYDAIQWAQEQYGEYPQRISKPHLSVKHSLQEVEQYAEDLKGYEHNKAYYDIQAKLYNDRVSGINDIIVEYISDMSGLNGIPEKSQVKVYNYAWSEGHSDGYYSVYQKLCDLVELFE